MANYSEDFITWLFNQTRGSNILITRNYLRRMIQVYESDFDTQFMQWFWSNYETVDDSDSLIKMKDIYARYKLSSLYLNLSKQMKRIYNKTYIQRLLTVDSSLTFKLRLDINGMSYRNVIVNLGNVID
jgi:hypothetical protein